MSTYNTWEMMVRSVRSVNILAKPESSVRGLGDRLARVL